MKKMLSAVLAILLLALPLVVHGAEPVPCGDAVGMSIMGFSTTDLNNNPVDDSIIGNTAITVFNFWASWCGPCVSEMPHFNQLYNYFQSTPEADVQIIGVAIDPSDVSSAYNYVTQHGYNWLQLKRCNKFMELLSTTADSSGSIGIPQTIIVDYNGLVLSHRVGSFSNYNQLYNFVNSDLQDVMENYPPVTVTVGDADSNGVINANDALLVLRYALGIIPDTELDLRAADYDENGTVNANDALAILRRALGL